MKTHWKKLDNPDYLGAYSLMDGDIKDLNVIIESVQIEEVKNERGAEPCKVARVKGQKPMILNSTNCKTIEKIAGSPYVEDWKGLEITLYIKKIKAFGETVDALRIRESAPKKPVLNPTHENWSKVVEGLKKGFTIQQVKSKYSISDAHLEKLQNEAV